MIDSPSDPKAETTAAIAKGIVSAIPFAGGLLAEVGNLYLNPLEKRKQKWMEDVSEVINQIRTELNILPEQLQEDESFLSALYQATEIAMRNHQSQKRMSLRNALVSAAASRGQDDDLNSKFLRYVDELSSTHIYVLNLLNVQAGQFARYEKLDQIYSLVTQLSRQMLDRVMFRSVLQDLETRFLIHLGDIEDFGEFKSKQDSLVTEGSQIRPISATSLGKSLLLYIRADQL